VGGIVLYEAGEKYTATFEALFEGTLDELRTRTETFEPGLVYQLVFELEPPISDVSRVYEFFKYIELKYPGIGLNYIGVSDDGRKVVLQLFDPPVIAKMLIAVVVIAIATAIISYFATQFVKAVTVLVEKLIPIPPLPPPPKELAPVVWIGVTAALTGLGAYLLSKAFKKLFK
jgi:hypothetical protein